MIPVSLAHRLQEADWIVGSDECGTGCWAGPAVICAAIIPREWHLSSHVKDSKQVRTEAARERMFEKIQATRLLYHLEVISHEEIDRVGMYKSVVRAHETAIIKVLEMHFKTGLGGDTVVVVDGTMKIEGAFSLPKADDLVPAVSAASILGKVTRDRMMHELNKQFPGYRFDKNKGYRSEDHLAGLEKLGPSEIHRKSYSPIAKIIAANASNTLFDNLPGVDE